MRKTDFTNLRDAMVDNQIASRGVRAPRVLDAMRHVPREAFMPEALRAVAYEDAPFPIAENQAISQPYIVALMIDALALEGGEKVLEIGTGSGYSAAVLSRIAGEVYTVERIGALAETSAAALAGLDYTNIHVLHADGTRGWPEHAPYDAIIVAAGGPAVPESLKAQLRVGGRLVMPVGSTRRVQELVRVTRLADDEYRTDDIADVRFVPLVGEEGWAQDDDRSAPPAPRPAASAQDKSLTSGIAAACERFEAIGAADLGPLLERIGEARVVLLGGATHGTAEFHRMRERISRELIERKGFAFVAIEGDWPDAARIDHHVRHAGHQPSEWTAFARFPAWVWRNQEVLRFVDWLRARNVGLDARARVAFHGLDLYSLHDSIRAILRYLDDVDPITARVARRRYGCLTPWQADPATCGCAVPTGALEASEHGVMAMLMQLMNKRNACAEHDGERFLDAAQNARLVARAEHYYQTMYYGSRSSWNLRDMHMFETLKTLLDFHGPQSRAIVWAHNSHVGDSTATEMALRGEYNLGQLCRREYGEMAYSVGFGTDSGTVAAASSWDGPVEIKAVLPALPGSYERLCHESRVPRFLLPLRRPATDDLTVQLSKPRIERAIGVIYRPESELQSHYGQAVLPRQFDEYVWFDETRAIAPLRTAEIEGVPGTYPFGV